MSTARKITVEVPRELLDRAQRASGAGITEISASASASRSTFGVLDDVDSRGRV